MKFLVLLYFTINYVYAFTQVEINNYKVETLVGTVEVKFEKRSKDDMEGESSSSYLTLNGKKINGYMSEKGANTYIKKKFIFNNKDVLLISTFYGMSAKSKYFFATFSKNASVYFSKSFTVTEEYIDFIGDSENILFDLGFDSNKKKTLVKYNDGDIILTIMKIKKGQATYKSCRDLYTAYNRVLLWYPATLEEDGLMYANGLPITNIRNDINLNLKNAEFLAQRDGKSRKKTSYKIFKKIVCGYESDLKIIASLLKKEGTINLKPIGYRNGEITFTNYFYEGESIYKIPNGYGLAKYKDGSKYEGQWKNGNWHGQGTYYDKSGFKYKGAWKDDLPNGYGTMTYASGAKYEGQWKNGNRHGKGTYHTTNGAQRTGYYKADKEVGEHIYISSKGTKYRQTWDNGKLIKSVNISRCSTYDECEYDSLKMCLSKIAGSQSCSRVLDELGYSSTLSSGVCGAATASLMNETYGNQDFYSDTANGIIDDLILNPASNSDNSLLELFGKLGKMSMVKRELVKCRKEFMRKYYYNN